jgi:hypothetical protein
MSESGSDNDQPQQQTGGLYECENHRLQREADVYTKDVEHEKKRHLITTD